jgi:thioredoxin reductase (NADPH)
MADRALGNAKIEPIWNTVPTAYLIDEQSEMRGIRLRDVQSGAERDLEVKCVFVAIGHTPNTAPFKGHLDMDENGYLLQHGGTATNVPGVFAAGDVADHVYRQAITAAGQGCAAALEAEKYLANLGEH